ncbi:hypothetical protein ETAA1_36380 [Urbifossiella limnaea]|uniref:Uncharacterized protein n=1 Tax=Urbifossiella limnaea TaxID=2528023 RepID=A0A517XW05_9BACT|nr:hypothetical protein ETAA1_36380 [Urbifossiella limnaea]
MPRLAPAVALLLFAYAGAARAQEPGKLRSPITQLFVRWDGVTAHKAAYDGSALGSALRGPTGDSARALLAHLPMMLGNDLLAGPLLEGKSPDELKAVHADLKAAEQILALLLDKGVIVAAPVTLAHLPPLPTDVSRFRLLRLDSAATYDSALTSFDVIDAPDDRSDETKVLAAARQRRRQELDRELTNTLGLNLGTDLMPYLGDRLCLYQSPTEGLSVFGQVVCVSVKDAAKVRAAADQLTRGVENLAGGRTKIRKRVVAEVDTREIYNREFGVVTPTCAVSGDLFVIGGTPQCVQGFALRHAGRLPMWSPDSETGARLTTMPSDAVGLQFCRPESVVKNICTVAPLFLSQTGQFSERNSSEFNPTEVGLVPNAHELCSHFFPNLTYTRDAGRTVRIDVHDSFSLPLEFIRFEPFLFAALTGLR